MAERLDRVLSLLLGATEPAEDEAADEGSSGVLLEDARRAIDCGDLVGAVAIVERGLACATSAEDLCALWLLRAEAHRWRGQNADVERCGLEAMELAPRGSPLWWTAAGEVAGAAGRLGHLGRLLDVATAIRDLGLAGSASPAAVVATVRSAIQLFQAGHYERADDLLAQAEAAPAGARVLGWLAWGRAARMQCSATVFAADIGLMRTAVARFEEAGDRRTACVSRVSLAHALLQVGDHRGAEEVLVEVLEGARRMPLYLIVPGAQVNLGLALARQGRLPEALEVAARAVETSRANSDRRSEGAARAYLAEILAQAGRSTDAEGEVRAAIALLRPSPPLCAHALAVLARVRLSSDRAGALEAAREAMALLESLGALEEGEATVRLVWAEALRASGDDRAALTALAAARARILERSAKIPDADARAGFLERVPENLRTLALFESWTR